MVTADRCPQVLCRLLGLFAQQDRMVEQVEARDMRRSLRVTLSVLDIDTHRAAIIADKMRQMIRVRTVKLVHRPAGKIPR